ncbi:T9SS type A sorting domain-containing protein [Flavobacterium daemonense]|uniref:T9SS type A sorting domain-containing protein n=1 Tax=Flavobacterium daemonense TaxID=1393049 RepID=UPI001185B57F|nr:T9SS type A sorting domain-containing protein [Flavobacterium daemonense]KAF2336283.1 T9SS type A sorting domain-containing protein [Flavobacterium daemonense]
MKTKLLLLLFLANFSIYAQYTTIPDLNFEKKLISLGLDSGAPDGKILTSNINTVINLDVTDSEIKDLTGIEDFTELVGLTCKLNLLTKLDLSKNIKLGILDCRGNNLTSLDFSKLPALVSVFCSENFLTDLDVSKNPILQGIFCSKNELISLNLKNGNNTKFKDLFFDFTDNPHLSCIEVDDPNYSNLNWADNKDKNAVYSSSCGQSYTNIPDKNFENKLINLGIDTDGINGRVLTANIISITSLDVSNSSISDLSGIENFMSLVTLNVSNNNLTSLKPLYSKKLKFLYCNNNLLTDLDLTKNSDLTTLNFSNNKLSAVDFWYNSLLTDVNGSSNLLTGVNFTNANLIKTLDLNNNQITDLQLNNNKLLTDVNCSKNLLSALDISALDQLKTLNVFSNQLKTLECKNNKMLTSLNCDNNLLSSLDVSTNSNLTSLSCRNNQLINLDVSLNTLLREILCDSNNLLELNLKNGANSLFTNYSFKNNINLECIQVDDEFYSNTNWTNSKDITATYNVLCDPYTLIPDINFEKKLIALGIDSGTADGKVLTSKIRFITSLDVSGSSIFDLTGIEKFIKLKTLNCSSNQLSDLNISKNNDLSNLICSNNKLGSLNISNNSNLTILNCSANNLSSLDVFANVKLEKINCANNQLTNLDVSKNIALISLDCSKNKITLLNLKNGKNTLTNTFETNFTSNAPLACILVDNPTVFNTSWLSKKDDLASYGSICSRYTLIPDINFEKKLISLGIDSGKADGKILSENIESLTSLNVSGSNISNLSGIEDFVALKGLYVSQNNITVLDISKNTKLTEFSCSENNLSTIDISKNTLLIQFACWGNKLSTVDVSKNPSLNVFECYNNAITTLDISNNKALGSILCYNNKLESLDVSQNANLWSISCYSNNLSKLDISKNNLLSYLDFTSNKIKDIDVSKNIKLRELSLDNNQVNKLDVSKNLLLEVLSVTNNSLTTLDVTLNNKLRSLSCSTNQLSILDVSKNLDLEYFTCSYNQLQNLDVFQNTKLKSIACSGNKIKTLNLSKNGLLTTIMCSNNNLTFLNIKNGNNANLDFIHTGYLNFANNPDLTCIQVDNETYSNTKWINKKDATATYNTNCGSTLVLPSDNFTVETKGESCLGQNNGEINITAKATYIYQTNIGGKAYTFSNNTLKVSNLIPGIYTISIIIPEENYEQIFNVTIQKGATITGKSSITAKKVDVEITEGTAPFTVFIDGQAQFETNDSSFSLDLEKGGLLEVVSSKACEGVYSKKIARLDIYGTLAAYPNPTSGSFEIEIPSQDKEVTIELYNFGGQLVSARNYSIENGKVKLNLEDQPSGIYAAKIYFETPEFVKIIKK